MGTGLHLKTVLRFQTSYLQQGKSLMYSWIHLAIQIKQYTQLDQMYKSCVYHQGQFFRIQDQEPNKGLDERVVKYASGFLLQNFK